MIIKELIIKKLYGHYNYHVNFNDDITIIYGLNGSGKTTILNILNSIISGKLFDLIEYEFDSVILLFQEDGIKKCIKLTKNDKSTFYFDSKEVKIKWPIEKMNTASSARRIRAKEIFYEYNPCLKDYFYKFNRVYLPLDRAINREEEMISERGALRIPYEALDDEKPINQVANIIQRNCMAIELQINRLNNEYRDKTLRTISMAYKRDNKDNNVMEYLYDKEKAINRITHVKNSYISLLKGLGILDKDAEGDFVNFIDDVIEKVKCYNLQSVPTDDIETFLKFTSSLEEIYRLETIVNHADNLEAEKKKCQRPLTMFKDTLNDFLKIGSEDGKRFIINEHRELCIENKYGERISLDHLSSGERQLVILFTHLIFIQNKNEEAVFIVDEPELSLHMFWQGIYIDKIREVASNVQIIFATHSPEIISHYKDKLFELVKTREDFDNENRFTASVQ